MSVEVVTVSSKGQIVLPTEMRKKLGIADGGALAALATDKVIVLKPLEMPTAEEFSGWLEEARAWAERNGCGKEEVKEAVTSVRRGKGK